MIRAVVVLTGVLVACGGVVACSGDDDAAEVPSGVTSVVDAFNDAINTYDTEALLAVTTEDFTWESTGDVQSRPEFVEHFEEYYEVGRFHAESTDEPEVKSDGGAYVVEVPGRVTSAGYDGDGLSVYRVVEVDDSWMVQEFRWSEI